DETDRARLDDGAFLDERLEDTAGFALHPVAGDDGRAEAGKPHLARRVDRGFTDAVGLKGEIRFQHGRSFRWVNLSRVCLAIEPNVRASIRAITLKSPRVLLVRPARLRATAFASATPPCPWCLKHSNPRPLMRRLRLLRRCSV